MRVLEIGAGGNPILEPGWEHLDIRPGPHIEHVWDASDLTPFADDSFDEIVARDVIEHISWRKVPDALRDWFRVAPKLTIETPDARELRRILDGLDSDNRMAGESDWAMFCRIAYGHQDYPANAHLSYFTPTWLELLLFEAGACRVDRKYADGHRFVLEAHRE